MSQNCIVIGCLSKIGQDQHLKLSPQSHILYLEVVFDKKHSKPLQANIHGRNSLSPPSHSFFI